MQHGSRIQEQQSLEQPVVQHVEQRAKEADSCERGCGRSVDRQQRHARTHAQQDVADLPNAVEGEQTLGLLLLQSLHGARE